MTDSLKSLAGLLRNNQPVTVLTGAGISVSSGLPVYRDTSGNWVHSKPVQGPEFRSNPFARQRYWSRSFVGWKEYNRAQPNAAHEELVSLQRHGHISHLITQNVDGLHEAAGSRNVIPLHGSLSQVICLQCGDLSARQSLQIRLQTLNPEFDTAQFTTLPDGDTKIDRQQSLDFTIANCQHCDGILKPHVVFFGDNVPVQRVQACKDNVLESGLLLCIGTSLMVYSGFRFCRLANESKIPVVIINRGVTRADDLATLKIEGDCSRVLRELSQQLTDDKR